MPSAATNDIGSGKSVPVISFAWGPKTLGQYSGNPNDQYAYLWVAVLKPDRSGIELYQAVNSSGQPWKAGNPTTGGSYTLVKTLSFPSGSPFSAPTWLGLTFSPSGKLRLVMVHEIRTTNPPSGRVKFAIDANNQAVPLFGVNIFRASGDQECTGVVALNTYQLHGRLDQATTIAISAVYNSAENGTRFLISNSVLEFLSPHIAQYPDGTPSNKRIRVLTRSAVTVSGYMKGKWCIASTNPVASPYSAMQVGGTGQILAYNPESGATEIISLSSTIPKGYYTPPVTIGLAGEAIESGGQPLGTPGSISIGEQQYGPQGEGLKINAVVVF